MPVRHQCVHADPKRNGTGSKSHDPNQGQGKSAGGDGKQYSRYQWLRLMNRLRVKPENAGRDCRGQDNPKSVTAPAKQPDQEADGKRRGRDRYGKLTGVTRLSQNVRRYELHPVFP